MKILFVGNYLPEKYSLDIKQNSLAGNKFQNKMIMTLRKNNQCDILSFIAVSLNEEQKILIKRESDNNNMYYYKGKNIIGSIIEYRKKMRKIINEYDAVFVYNVAYPWLKISKYFKKNKSVLILADFSDSISYDNILLKVYAKICKKDIMKYNYVVGLSKNTKEILKNNQKFICIPGGIDLLDYAQAKPVKRVCNKIKIMYSGNLSKVTGVDLLIEAVKKIKNNNFQLLITGRGDLEKYVQDSSDGDKIKYLGSLPYVDYLNTLNEANILINPRNMSLPENNNNFPSKVMDYLAVGKVVISTKFIGYEDFIDNFYFCDSTIDSIMNQIDYCVNNYDKIYYNCFKKNLRKSKEYDWNVQIEKIIDMIKEEV